MSYKTIKRVRVFSVSKCLDLGLQPKFQYKPLCTGMLKPFQHEKQEENLCLLVEDQTSEWWFEEAFLQKFEGGTSRGKTDKSRIVLVEVGIGESWRPSLCLHPHCPTLAAPGEALWNSRGSTAPGLKNHCIRVSIGHGSWGPVL